MQPLRYPLNVPLLVVCVMIVALSHARVGLRAQELKDKSDDAPLKVVDFKTANAPIDATKPTEQNPDPTGGDLRNSVGMLIVQSGFFGILFTVVLGLLSVVALMVAIERLVNLRRGKVAPAHFLSRLAELCRRPRCTADEMKQLADSDRSPVARILKAGLTRAGRPLPEVEKALEDAAAREVAALRARHRALSVIGSVAPLVGLLGTVVGMIFAFETTSRLGLGRGDQLAGAIHLALFTTAAGLTIAVPCILLTAWFNVRIERYLREMDESLLDTMPIFARLEERSVHQARLELSFQPQEELVATGQG